MTALPKPTGTARAAAATAVSSRRTGEIARVVVVYALLIGVSLIFLMPLLWMIITSIKTKQEAYIFPPTIIPREFHLVNYSEAWDYTGMQFTRWTLNTVLISVTVLIGTLLTSSLCAYGFARIKFPGRDFWFLAVLASIMLPPQVTLIPLYILFFKIKWLDTFYPLIIPTWFGGGALNIFLLRQFFMQIPTELEDAALIDGAGRLQIWWRIFLPLSLPGIITVGIFTFQNTWNDFLNPLIYLRSPDNYTLALGMNLFRGGYGSRDEIQYMMAVAFLMTIPMIVVFFAAQRYFIRGIVLTGLNR
jgi:multiple sugar transport system permease protein